MADLEEIIKDSTRKLVDAGRQNTDKLVEARHQDADKVAKAELQAADKVANAEIQAANTLANASHQDTMHSIDAMYTNTGLIIASQEKGFAALGKSVLIGAAETVKAIGKMSMDICDRLDAIDRKLDNPLQTQVWELYRLALDSFYDGHYEDARNFLLQALEKINTNYPSWFLLGMAYLGMYLHKGEYRDVISLDEAIRSLTKSADYIRPKARENRDVKELARYYSSSLGMVKHFKSKLYAAETEEARRLLSEAKEAFEESWEYSDKMWPEARYNVARCKALLSDTKGALAELEALIENDAVYYERSNSEPDFDAIREDYNRLIERMRAELYQEAAVMFAEIRSLYVKAQADGLMPYFSGGTKGEIDRFIWAGISSNLLPYLDIRESRTSCSDFLTHLNDWVKEAAEAKTTAENRKRVAEAAEEKRKRVAEAVDASRKREAKEAEEKWKREAEVAEREAQEKAKKKRNAIIGCVIGLLIIVGAFILAGTKKQPVPKIDETSAVETPAPKTATVTSNSLNFRSGPGTDSKVLKTLKKGETLTVTGDTAKGWVPVEHGGTQGYVSADLITIGE